MCKIIESSDEELLRLLLTLRYGTPMITPNSQPILNIKDISALVKLSRSTVALYLKHAMS